MPSSGGSPTPLAASFPRRRQSALQGLLAVGGASEKQPRFRWDLTNPPVAMEGEFWKLRARYLETWILEIEKTKCSCKEFNPGATLGEGGAGAGGSFLGRGFTGRGAILEGAKVSTARGLVGAQQFAFKPPARGREKERRKKSTFTCKRDACFSPELSQQVNFIFVLERESNEFPHSYIRLSRFIHLFT